MNKTLVKKIVKVILFCFIGILVIVISGGLIISTFYEEEVKALVIKKINESTDGEVSFSDVTFSVLKRFPNASIQFVDLKIKGSAKFKWNEFSSKQSRELLYARNLFLLFNISDIFTKKYNITGIYAYKGRLNLLYSKSGMGNYEIWSEEGNNSSDFTIDLSKIFAKDFDFQYFDIVIFFYFKYF